MARKREALKDLDYQSVEYWNRLLAEEQMSMDQGLHPDLLYVGDSARVETIEGFHRTDTGRINPKPQAD